MSKVLKAGVPHAIKVETSNDVMGIASGFNFVYFDEATKVPTEVVNPFVELEATIVPTSSTLVGAHNAPSNPKLPQVLNLVSVAGFNVGSAVKLGNEYRRVIAVNVGENKLTVKTGFKVAALDGDTVELSGKTGTYAVDVTFPAAGNYTIQITNFAAGMDFKPSSVMVQNANIDDVKNALTAAQGDITAIKAVTDILQTAELNNIKEQIESAKAALDSLIVIVDSADAQDAVTSIRELLVDLKEGGVNVDSLVNGQADIKAMLSGNEFLANGTTPNPLFGKGLDEIFDSVANTLTTLNNAITASTTAITTAVDAAKASVETKVAAVQTVVDANKALLENGTFGLASIKTALDAVNNLFADGGATDLRFDSIDNVLSNLGNALNAQTTHIDGKFDEVMNKLQEMETAAQYSVFA